MKKESDVFPAPRGRIASLLRVSAVRLPAVALLLLLPAASAFADAPDFRFDPPLAGRASLVEDGFVVKRELGVLAVAPELRIPLELVYESHSEVSGPFGFAWRCPQLESSAKWTRGRLVWMPPWGGTLEFCPKNEKPPEGAARIDVVEAARRGRGLFAPYSDWEADASESDYAKARRFTVFGRNGMRGWCFEYENGALVRIATPRGTVAEFGRAGDGAFLAVSARGVRFAEAERGADGRVAALRVNGAPVALSYAPVARTRLPKTVDGRPEARTETALSSLRVASLDAEAFAYAGGFLAFAKRGAREERFAVQSETPADRRANLLSREPKSKVRHTGRVAGRLLSDGALSYSYGSRTGVVSLKDAVGRTSSHDLDLRTGVRRRTGFDGRTETAYYLVRPDSAAMGRVREVVDGRGRVLAAFRYDRLSGRLLRAADRLGGHRLFEYDGAGNCVKLLRRAAGAFSSEPVRAFAHDAAGRVVSVSELGADGRAVRTAKVERDRAGRPVRVSDGRRDVRVAWGANGFPTEVSDGVHAVKIAYDRWNRPVSTTDGGGISTVRTYADHGGIAKVERRDGASVLASLSVAYDGAGRPVSVTDGEGRTTACSRDALGRVVAECFPDGAGTAYAYDAAGRLLKAVDENGHGILFSWDASGLASRTTAVGQKTEFRRGADGFVSEMASSWTGRVDRVVKRTADGHGRPTRVEWAAGEVETFAYDEWGRISEHARGKRKASYAYDHFGRLTEKREGGLVWRYAYDAWGARTRLTVSSEAGGVVHDERRAYDGRGLLVAVSSAGRVVRWSYDRDGRVSRRTVDGFPTDFAWTRDGRPAAAWLGGRAAPVATVEYAWSPAGRLLSRVVDGARQTYEHDARGRLVAVRGTDGAELERYEYDPAGNVLAKTVGGRRTAYAYDAANQLVSATASNGAVTAFGYDAAGRMVREGARTYRYGWLDKVLSVSDGASSFAYEYHADGQLARATSAKAGEGAPPAFASEEFLWDGLALVRRGGVSYVNGPHPGGGEVLASSDGAAHFNDVLGTTLGVRSAGGYAPTPHTAFGDVLPLGAAGTSPSTVAGRSSADAVAASALPSTFFTGKPRVAGLGHAFLLRNYRADLSRWPTLDPLGYPDGWNGFAYCGNDVTRGLDFCGAKYVYKSFVYMVEYSDLVVIPQGMPLDLPNVSPSFWVTFLSYMTGNGAEIVMDYVKEIAIPLWCEYKYYGNEQGIGKIHDETAEEAKEVMRNRGYADEWEFVSVDFFSTTFVADHIPPSVMVRRMRPTWEVIMRKEE